MTDDQWQKWLQDGSQVRCTLARLTFLGANPASPDAAQEHYAYIADMIYAPPAATQRYSVCITEVPSINESMSEQLEGESELSFGNLVVTIKDADVRNKWLGLNFDGREYIQYLGHPSWPFSDFRVVLKGVLDTPEDLGGGQISFPIMDRSALLDVPVMTTLMGGTDAQAGDLKPLVLGSEVGVTNITPKLYDSALLQYRVTQENPGAIDVVRDSGVDLSSEIELLSCDLTANTFTSTAAHGLTAGKRVRFPLWFDEDTHIPTPLTPDTSYYVIASGLTSNAFKISTTVGGAEIDLLAAPTGSLSQVIVYNWSYFPLTGILQLDTSPTGVITCDMRGLMTGGIVVGDALTGGTAVNTAAEIINFLLTSDQTNTPFTSADIDATSLAAFDLLCPQSLGIYLTEQISFNELLDQIVLSVGGWRGFDPATGKMIFGRLYLPAGGIPVYTFNAGDINDWSLKKEKTIAPKAQVKVKGVKNWTVQTSGLAGAVGVSERALYGRDYYTALGSLGFLDGEFENPASHRLANYPQPYETFLASESETQTEASRRAVLYQYPRAIRTYETDEVVFLIKRGDLIYVDDDEFTGFGIVVGATKNVDALSTVRVFTAETTTHPQGDLND